MSRRAYNELRTMVEQHGGTMTFERIGFSPGGAWIIRYDEKEKVFPIAGRHFPGIDELHVPKIHNPKKWDDYQRVLVDGAWENILHQLTQLD